MKKVKYLGDIYTVEEEFHDSYKLSGSVWVKKALCEEIDEFSLTPLSRIIIVLIISYLTLLTIWNT